MAVYRHQFYAQDKQGNIIPGASVTVRLESNNGIASVYSDNAGAVAKANPFTADSNGYVFFYADPGKYRIIVTSAAGSSEFRDVDLGLVFDAPRAPVAGRTYLTLKAVSGAGNGGVFQMVGATAGSANNGNIEWHDDFNTGSTTTCTAFITSGVDGATAGNVGSRIEIATKKSGEASAGVVRARINQRGWMSLSTLGAVEPSSQLEIVGESGAEADADVRIVKYGGTLGGVVHGMHATGTPAAPGATPDASLVLGMGGRAHDGTRFQDHSASAVHFISSGLQSPTNWGQFARFWTTPTGSVVRAPTMDIKEGYLVEVGGLTAGLGGMVKCVSDNPSQIADFWAESYGAAGGQFHGYHARGTKAAPSATLARDVVSGYGSRSWASGWPAVGSGASIHFVASENHAPTSRGTYTQLKTTPNGSDVPIERVVITQDGSLWHHDSSLLWDPLNTLHTRPVADARFLSSVCADSGAASGSSSIVGYGVASIGFRGLAARGTPVAPTAVQSGDFLCFMGGLGYDSTAFTAGNKGLIAFKAAENWTATTTGCYFTFETTAIGTTSRLERMRLLDDGGFAIGQTTVTSGFKVEVAGDIRCTSLTQTSDGDRKIVQGPSLGLDFILALDPVTFRWKDTAPTVVEAIDETTGDRVSVEVPGETFSRSHQGVIYQQVEQAAASLGVDFGGLKDPAKRGEAGDKGIDYSEFFAPLIMAIKELHGQNQELAAEIAELKKQRG